METFLLNPAATAQRPVSSQHSAATANVAGDDEFSPLLNEAVASRKNEETPQGDSRQTDPSSGVDEITNEPQQGDENNSAQSAIQTATILSSQAIETVGTVDTTQAAFSAELLTEPGKTGQQQPSPIPSQTEPIAPAKSTTPAAFTTESELAKQLTKQQLATSASQTVSEDAANLFPHESHAPGTPAGSTEKIENPLLQQIQQILTQGKENGSIKINASTVPVPGNQNQMEPLQNLPHALLTNTDTENMTHQARQITIPVPGADDSTVQSQKSAKLENSHQDISQQFLHAKMGDSNNNNTNSSGNPDHHNSSQQKNLEAQFISENQTPANGSPGATGSEIKSGDTIFGQQLGFSSTTSTSSSGIEGKFAPGAEIPVPEKEMVSSLIQRFNANPRLQTSKLTMQLNPAELGALKIDILVKGDSIKANIVAQSQQVLETLEKHMPRLRTILQDQGFSVDAFDISMEGEGGNQKELFQEQFNSQQQEFAFTKSSSPQSESFETLPDTINSDDPGINLTV